MLYMKSMVIEKLPPLPPLPEDCPQQIPSWAWVRFWVGSNLWGVGGGGVNLPGSNFLSSERYVLLYSVNDL